MDFSRKAYPFLCTGMNLTMPVDRMGPAKYRYLKNTRAYGGGMIAGRPGFVKQNADAPMTGGAVHTIKRVNDPIPDPIQFPGAYVTWGHIVGCGTHLYILRNDPSPVLPEEVGDAPETGSKVAFSGHPLSVVVQRPENSPHTHAYIFDNLINRKMMVEPRCCFIGIAPPNTAPSAAVVGGTANGPDNSANSVPYVYRYTARAAGDIRSGCVSNPGPAIREVDGILTAGEYIQVTIPTAHLDTQASWLDIYRFGGSLSEWIWVGTVNNIAGAQLTDPYPDDAIAGNPRLVEDNYQPFVTVDSTRNGTCTITTNGVGKGAILTWTSGDVFKYYNPVGDLPYYPPGTLISINGNAATFYRIPDDAHTVEIFEDYSGVAPGTACNFVITNPELVHQPLQCAWGPFGGGQTGTFTFAVGDILNPGSLYWLKGNNPDAHAPTNVLEITSPSEPLMNGCMFNGASLVFSTERMFTIYPSFGQVSDFLAVEVPNSKGLYAKWALAVGPKIWFLARDGIYETTGGAPVSITDADLYPMFEHEESETAYVADGQPTSPIPAINFTAEDSLRLSYGDGFLYFDYLGTDAAYHTLVHDTVIGGWISLDEYTPTIALHYLDEGRQYAQANKGIAEGLVHEIWMGSSDGNLYAFGGVNDDGQTIVGAIRTSALDMGDTRPRKFFGDIMLDYDSDCEELDVQIGFDNFTFLSSVEVPGLDLHGRRRAVGDINSGTGQYAFNIGLWIQWEHSIGLPKFFFWEPSFVPKPEITARRVTDWSDDNYIGDKFVQGLILRADTLGVARTVNIEYDGGASFALTVNHDGESEKPYSFAQPFITHLLRFHPMDTDFWRYFSVRWVWEPAPELVPYWTTQETTHDLRGYFHHRDAYIATISSAAVIMSVKVDSGTFNYTIPSGAGSYTKPYTVLQPMKGKFSQYALSSASPFRLFVKDCEVRVKPWGEQGPYQIKNPFGDVSRVAGARI